MMSEWVATPQGRTTRVEPLQALDHVVSAYWASFKILLMLGGAVRSAHETNAVPVADVAIAELAPLLVGGLVIGHERVLENE